MAKTHENNAHPMSRYARHAATLLGRRIKMRRKLRGWSELELARRAGISRSTLQRVENGAAGCAVGVVFEAAALVGVRLFEADKPSLPAQISQTNEMTALLPRRARAAKGQTRDDF